MACFSVVPGNIKQLMLPFLLQPGASLNTSENGKSGSPLYFTFRYNNGTFPSGNGLLNFCPNTLQKYINDDISFKQLYNQGKGVTTSLLFNYLLDNIPGIQIREFLPDTALDQAINFFVDLMKEVTSLFGDNGISTGAETKKKVNGKEVDMSKEEKAAAQDSFFKKLTNVAWFLVKYVTGTTGDGNDLITNFLTGGSDIDHGMSGDKVKYILDFPYMLYYRLLSCTTTGIYEIPAVNSGNKLYSSDGAPGWNADESSGFRFLPKSLQNIPVIGGILGKLFGNIGVSWMPWWDAASGNATPEPTVELTFDLFNDTSDAAMMNFIFVNTIVPNNKWIQYGLFLHSSNLYDIKLEGYNRLFACTGKFEVSYKGVLRDPPDSWFESADGLKKYVNSKLGASFLSKCKSQKLIKIPDIYTVKMTFDSVLPSNFNQYLYTMVANTNHIEKYSSKSYEPSGATKALGKAIKGMLEGAKNAWDDGGKYIPKEEVG